VILAAAAVLAGYLPARRAAAVKTSTIEQHSPGFRLQLSEVANAGKGCTPFPAIRCVPMPGHTPGHQAIYVATQSGTAIICGDAAMNVAVNVDKPVPSRLPG
jgi:glyoxylase-like metal-dependent hydrolase (beta-lactamase superfamily II)